MIYTTSLPYSRTRDLSFQKSPDKSQISYFLLCNYIDLFNPVAILESDRLFNHAQSLQLAGDKGHTILPGPGTRTPSPPLSFFTRYWKKSVFRLSERLKPTKLPTERLRYLLHNVIFGFLIPEAKKPMIRKRYFFN